MPRLHHMQVWNGTVFVHDDEGEIARRAFTRASRTRCGCAGLRYRPSVRWYRSALAPVRYALRSPSLALLASHQGLTGACIPIHAKHAS